VWTSHTVICETPSCMAVILVLVSGFAEITLRILPSCRDINTVHSHLAAH
jgi:hypothetical protein